MPAVGSIEPVTAAKNLRDVRCSGKFRGEPCNRILFRATALPLKPGSIVEIKCGKCEEVSYIVGGPPE
jgi:phage FluMu protein Com